MKRRNLLILVSLSAILPFVLLAEAKKPETFGSCTVLDRNGYNGEKELASQANQGKAPNEFTDWIETSANYVEYYMEGNLFLHLGKNDVHTSGK